MSVKHSKTNSVYKRRKFSVAFKRRISAKYTKLRTAGMAHTPALEKLRLPSSATKWLTGPFAPSEARQTVDSTDSTVKKPASSPVPLEALVYLRHARKAMDLTKRLTKAELLTLLALETLEAK